jgi:hypothetical protein
VQENRKSLLVRADFILGHSQPGDRRTYKRWRGILRDVLPRLFGCERRCARAEKVRLRSVNDHPLFSAWLRIPIERRPGKNRIRKLRERLRSRLERSLLLIDGQVVKISIRCCRARVEGEANWPVRAVENAPQVGLPRPVEEPVALPLLAVQAEPALPPAQGETVTTGWEQAASPTPAA